MINMMIMNMMLCGLLVFCSTRKHILLSLLSIEFMMLSIFYLLFLTMLNYDYELYYILMFLIFSVCEAALGLSILVMLVRTQGNDYLSSISTLSW
nr:NADH dehydrogenase subunit 4L [Dalcantha dilatata]